MFEKSTFRVNELAQKSDVPLNSSIKKLLNLLKSCVLFAVFNERNQKMLNQFGSILRKLILKVCSSVSGLLETVNPPQNSLSFKVNYGILKWTKYLSLKTRNINVL